MTALLTWLVLQAFTIGRFVIRVFLLLAISLGVLRGLTPTDVPAVGSLVTWAQAIQPQFPGSELFLWVGQNWIALVLFWLFLYSRAALRTFEELRTTSNYTKLFMATVGNYLRIETASESTKQLQEKGALSLIQSGLSERLLLTVLGVKGPDPYLSA